MATFGNTSIGGTPASITGDQIQTTHLVNLPEEGITNSIWIYTACDTGAPRNARAVIYDSSNNLVAFGNETLISNDYPSNIGWIEFPIPNVYLASGDYYIGFGFDAIPYPGTVFYYYDDVTAANRGAQNFTFASFPASLTPISSTRKISAYVEYTPVPVVAFLTA